MERIRRIILSLFLLLIIRYGNGEEVPQADSSQSLISEIQFPGGSQQYKLLCTKAEQASDTDSIVKYSNEAIEIAMKSSVNPAIALILKGNGLHLSGKLTLAVECFTKAAKFYQEANNIIGVASAYLYLSGAYISQQNHRNATHYLNRAIEILELEKDSTRLASAIHNLGFEYYRVQQYDSALLLFANAGDIYRNLNYEVEIAYCIGNSGLVYSKLDELAEAENKLLEAIDILEKHTDAYAIAEFTTEYAYVLQRKGDVQSALKHAYKSLDIATSNNITELKRDAAFRLFKIYEQVQRFDSAFHYQMIYYTYSDSIRNLESIQKTADLRTEFEVSKKQVEVDILEKNKALQRIVIGSLGLIILLAAGFSIITYVSLKRNRKLTVILEERQKQLELQSSELSELNRIKDRFFSIISHDLRAPLSSLGGVSFLIKESIKSNNKAQLNQVTEYIDQTVLSLTGLLDNLLSWALSQQGSFPYKKEFIELESVINEVVSAFISVIQSKDQQIDLHLEPGLTIHADKNSMMTLLRNLVSNALKYSNSGASIYITTKTLDKKVAEIRIVDKGIGISKERMEDLFILKADKSSRGTENEKGIGLGLNLVGEFVKMNKGMIQVESKVDEGTTFRLHFPL